MSKKNKKLKKKFKQEIFAQALKEERQETPQKTSNPLPNISKDTSLNQSDTFDAKTVKSDLIKIALLFSALVIVVIVIYFINLKVPIIDNLANFLSKSLNIN